MSWFPVDDAFHGHPKGRRAGLEAIGLWTVSGSYCMAYLTDGFVPAWFVHEKPKGKTLAKRLVDAGLWVPGEKDCEPGWWFHDWKPECTKAHIADVRKKARDRKAKSRESRGESRVTDGVTVDLNERTSHSKPLRNGGSPSGFLSENEALSAQVDPHQGAGESGSRNPLTSNNTRLSRVTAAEQDGGVLGYTQPNPTQPITSSGQERGEGPESNARNTPPRPHCHDHPDGNASTPCGRCQARREWDKHHAAELEADELERRRAAKSADMRALAECTTCDEFGWLLGPDRTPVEPGVRCTHHLQAQAR